MIAVPVLCGKCRRGPMEQRLGKLVEGIWICRVCIEQGAE